MATRVGRVRRFNALRRGVQTAARRFLGVSTGSARVLGGAGMGLPFGGRRTQGAIMHGRRVAVSRVSGVVMP